MFHRFGPTPSFFAAILATVCFPIVNTWATEVSEPVVAAPGEAGLRAALNRVADGGTVTFTDSIELASTVNLDRSVTIRYGGPRPWGNVIAGQFEGTLFSLGGAEVRFDGVEFRGSSKTDGLTRVRSGATTLRECALYGFRVPARNEHWSTEHSLLRLDTVRVAGNVNGPEVDRLEATNSLFSGNQQIGASAYLASIVDCRFEGNGFDGLIVTYGTVRRSVFRYNGSFGLRFDPDPGVLQLSGCLFYANVGGGLLLRESAQATVDNCTFTRHTGPPAVVVSEAGKVLFRHCTVTDNLVLGGGQPGLWPSYPKGAAFAIMSGEVELQNCLVADNPTDESAQADGLAGMWTDGGGNVIGGPAGLAYVGLGEDSIPFALVPRPGSRAIDAGRLSDVVRDGRGLSRLAKARPDAGAIETESKELVDADGDGIPDLWEVFRGLNPLDAADAGLDADGDGSSALAEYRTGTNPRDSASVLRITGIELRPNLFGDGQAYVELRWNDIPGVEIRLETASDFQEWRSVSGILWPQWSVQVPANSSGAFFRLVGVR